MAPHIGKPRSRQFIELKRVIADAFDRPSDVAGEISQLTKLYWHLSDIQKDSVVNATMAEIARYYRYRYRRTYRPSRRLR